MSADDKPRRRHSPLNAAVEFGPSGRRPYWGVAYQRTCILSRLMKGPATCAELSQLCGARSATKRVSELRRAGFAIESGWASIAGPGGTVSLSAVYHLAEPDDRQRDLFAEEAAT
ncbi:MAG: hypothetical protein HYZ20_16560 [Burkholderiales bacterium]|nr:hypothetical protein [Burkholderiales bacterium]